MKPLVYVAGPITGNPWGCVRDAGCVPFIPQLSVLHEMVDPQPYGDWLAYDDDIIAHCHALVRLPGDSKGADHEVELAERLGLPVFIVERHDIVSGAPFSAGSRPTAVDVAQWAHRWRRDRAA